MIIVMKPGASDGQTEAVLAKIRDLGYEPKPIYGVERTVIGAVGDERIQHTLETLVVMPGVDTVIPIQAKYKMVSRAFHPASTEVAVGPYVFGGKEFHIIAGPCSVETEKQIISTAWAVRSAGATFLRGGAHKPRTSPYAFQGLGTEGLDLLRQARRETGMPIVTEVMAPEQVAAVAEAADMLQIGTRNMYNVHLLTAAARSGKPILLKRGFAATVEEWLLAAEYILLEGNDQVILCERGIRTFEPSTRNTLDVSAVAIAKQESHLPVVVDPSHAAGRWDLVLPLSRAAVAAGADGLLVEVHPHPEDAYSDGAQSVTPSQFSDLVQRLRPVVEAMGRRYAPVVGRV